MSDIDNRTILDAINKLKKNGQTDVVGNTITKEDILQTMVLLYFFKQKGKVLDTTEQKLPNIRLVDLRPDNYEKDDYLRMEYIIRDILSKINKRIDGSVSTSDGKIESIHAKKNLARIMYFIAMDTCDAIVDNSIDTSAIKQYKAEIVNNTLAILSTRMVNTPEEREYAKKLFIIASSLAENKVTILGNNTKPIVCSHVLKFIPDIIDHKSLFTSTVTDQKHLVENVQHNDESHRKDIVFDTQFPVIEGTQPLSFAKGATDFATYLAKGATDFATSAVAKSVAPSPVTKGVVTNVADAKEMLDKYTKATTVNLRVIQTILIGHGVVPKTKTEIDWKEGKPEKTTATIDMLYKAFNIDPGACS